jgi:hypothetical protein
MSCHVMLCYVSKTHLLQFTTKHGPQINLDGSCADKIMFKTHGNNFLGLLIDSTLSWMLHTEQVLHRISAVCHVHLSWSNENALLYYFHSTMSYAIIFWGNCTDSTKIFKMQKRAIRTITGSKNWDSCRDLFKNLKILPLHSQYIVSGDLW